MRPSELAIASPRMDESIADVRERLRSGAPVLTPRQSIERFKFGRNRMRDVRNIEKCFDLLISRKVPPLPGSVRALILNESRPAQQFKARLSSRYRFFHRIWPIHGEKSSDRQPQNFMPERIRPEIHPSRERFGKRPPVVVVAPRKASEPGIYSRGMPPFPYHLIAIILPGKEDRRRPPSRGKRK